MPEEIDLTNNPEYKEVKAPAILPEQAVLPYKKKYLIIPTDEEEKKALEKGRPVPEQSIEQRVNYLHFDGVSGEWKSFNTSNGLLGKGVSVLNAGKISAGMLNMFSAELAAWLSGASVIHPFSDFDPGESEGGIRAVVAESPLTASFSSIFYEVKRTISQFVEFPSDDELYVVSVWALATYFYRMFPSFPYLFVNAPKQSGKTRLLQVLQEVCFYAHPVVSSITSSSLFRSLDAVGGTLLIDEIEGIERNEEMRSDLSSILNAGYKRGIPARRSEARSVGGVRTFVSVDYDVYGPKALANIRGVGDVLQDRSIVIRLKRSKDSAVVGRDLQDEDWQALRAGVLVSCVGVAGSVWQEYKRLWRMSFDDEVLLKASGREKELWYPLLAVGRVVGEEVFQFLFQAFRRRVQERIDAGGGLSDLDVMVLQAFYQVGVGREYAGKLEAVIPTREVAEEFNRLFSEDLENSFSSRRVGRVLSRMGFKKAKAGHAGKIKGFLFVKEEVEDYARRYDVEL